MATLDSIQIAVDSLTSSTTSLLSEVTVNKSTLTNSAATAASNAVSANASAVSASSNAITASSAATQSAASAASAAAIVTGVASNRPSIRPSLLLDFANTRTLDPRITFARASTATFYDDKTTAVAEQNLILYSQDLSNAAWTKTNSTIVANATVAPDGTSTAGNLTYTTTGSLSRAASSTNVAVISGQTVTKSVFLKTNGQQFTQIPFLVSGSQYANFDIVNGTVTQTSASCTASIVSFGNGWYRCIATATYTSSGNDVAYVYALDNGTSGFAAVTTTGSSVYVWGAQLEQRSTVTAYTPTTTQAITNYIPVLQTAASGAARFDHNPTTGESLGLLIEEQRTNLFLRSEEFDNASWQRAATKNAVTPNVAIAIDGTLTADRFYTIPSAVTGEQYIRQSFSSTSVHTTSFYIKKDNWRYVLIRCVNQNIFDFDTGTFTVALDTLTAISVGNGWYRITATGTTSGTFFPSIGLAQNETTISWTAPVENAGVYIWGAQLEVGAFPTSYIPTVASQVTRAADSASMTGTNFSSWYNQSEGTVYGAYLGSEGNASRRVASINDATLNNNIVLLASNTSGTIANFGQVIVNAAAVADLGTGSYSSINQIGALAYKFNAVSFSKNGAAALVDTSATVPVVSQMQIGVAGSSAHLNGTIKRIAYYPQALTSTELQGLTS